ncbi:MULTISPECIES: L-serine ammonia-lyase [unclassified Caballeronia]|uniref:L-serine ammonia-lyase n=1 Tax=unclassified Caballeronia TaxID=2646786 RepID=UPI001F33294E|nr:MULTISPECIES: L-serine ammonia-lyase [unclassified Caballeronia]MCE4547318.1 L-serine ammonia-lyase [Caballeronia sp. PC1]MCE4575301.1 L-serine ammonia-lyase [Caballeronia sp. CLC5]
MALSVFDLFKVGIGPSSSHTVGPMQAAAQFVQGIEDDAQLFARVCRVRVELYGSLSATGRGHGTVSAAILGLEGQHPETVDVDSIEPSIARTRETRSIELGGKRTIEFEERRDIVFFRKSLPAHPNAMKLFAIGEDRETVLREETYYSIGGGFIVNASCGGVVATAESQEVRFPFSTGVELLQICQKETKSIAELVMVNETTWRPENEVRARLLEIWGVMQQCVARGCTTEGVMPGPLQVKRRAAALYRKLTASPEKAMQDSLSVMDWVNLYALAVNEENAGGGRVVTAPTNGAAGIVPAVLHYYSRFVPHADEEGVIRFLLTAAAIGMLYKLNASISGAEVGCQGEVGVACSMAAGGLVAAMKGSPEQVEHAAEIGMEHNLGLTCDPIGGLVQVPCIERNAMGSIKAINSARMALQSDGQHYVSLDSVIKTMAETGADMKTKYKETARGGLAVNVIEC